MSEQLHPDALAEALANIPDSANMPNSMAVNQEQLAQEASSVITTNLRSKYYGVYDNTNESNMGQFAFRSAVKLSGNSKKPRWMNLGYFNCEHVAAMAYNVAAINYFGVKAWINPVDNSKCDREELARFNSHRSEYIAKSVQKINDIHEQGGSLQYVDLDAERGSANA